jgi:hypothetical protein
MCARDLYSGCCNISTALLTMVAVIGKKNAVRPARLSATITNGIIIYVLDPVAGTGSKKIKQCLDQE